MKKDTYTKPEAMGIIADTLEKSGLYQPVKPYTMEEYHELTARACTLAVSGEIDKADHIRKSLDRHSPDYIKRLQTATGGSLQGKPDCT